MKEISRKLNSLLMELDECTDQRSEHDILSKIEKLSSEYRINMTGDDEAGQYYVLANNIMINDICKYLNWYKEHYDYPAHNHYNFVTWKNCAGSYSLTVRVNQHKVMTGGLVSKTVDMRRYYILELLGIDKVYDNLDYRKIRYLTKDEYDKFLAIRELNENYFLPYIKDIIKSMAEDVELKKPRNGARV